jgi:hypothetical protein
MCASFLFQSGFTDQHAYLPIQSSDRSLRRDFLVSIKSNEATYVKFYFAMINRDRNGVSESADAALIPLFGGKR